MLIEYNYKIEEIDKSLYNGKTTDIKQLEYLSKEKERLMEIVSNRETELLDLMDELELIDKDIMQIEEFLQKYKDRIRKQRKKYSALEQKLKSKIEEEKQEIVSIEGNMNEILLEKYYSIKKNKGSGVSIPQNGVCNRCNMILPMILLDRLNKGEIVLCENCGRILCKQS
jgi:predicted  nucleic acid-binding Zn-ribbon protein